MKQTISFAKNAGQKFYSLIKRNLVVFFVFFFVKSNSYSRQFQVFEATNLLSVHPTEKHIVLKKNGLESSIKCWKHYSFFWVILELRNWFCNSFSRKKLEFPLFVFNISNCSFLIAINSSCNHC